MEKKKGKKIFDFLKNNWLNLIILLFLLLVFFSSNTMKFKSSSEFGGYDSMNSGVSNDMETYDKVRTNIVGENSNSYKVQRASLTIESENYNTGKDNLNNLIQKYNGLINRKNEWRNNKNIRNLNLEVKIPNKDLSYFLNDIRSIFGDGLKSLNLYSYDVTEQKQDYSERLERYKSQIQKYKEMLQRENLKVEDEIKIQNRIDQLENQIYYLERSNKDLDNKINYSIVSISLNEKASPLTNIEFKSFKYYIAEFLNSLESGLNLFVKLLAYGLEFLLLFIIYKLVRNKFFK